MILAAALALNLLAGQASPAATFDARIVESAAAAEALQGPLDGTWALEDRRRRILYLLQISDPPHTSTPPQGAWRSFGGGALGAIDQVQRSGDRLAIRFWSQPGVRAVTIRLTRRGAGDWRGDMTTGRGREVVRLSRRP